MTLASRLSMTRYGLLVRCNGDLSLPAFAGNLLRGAFGAALREISCLTGASDCVDCALAAQCPYAGWIEPRALHTMGLLPQGATVPPPWIIEPPMGGAERYRAQAEFSFSFVVFGRAHRELPLCLLAFRRALSRGFGRERAPLEIVGIREDGREQWSSVAAFVSGLPTIPALPPAPDLVRLRFETPVSIVRSGRILGPADLRFRDFIGALQRRLGLLESCYEGTSSVWDYRACLQEAESFPWRAIHFQEVDLVRHSHRQHRTMRWSGVVGEYILDPLPESLWPILYRGQWSHVGKHASFGLGRYQVLSEDKFAQS